MKTKTFGFAAAFALLALSGLTGADARDADGRAAVTLWNQSGYTIERFYMSASDDRSWRGDLLGSSVLASGHYAIFYADLDTYDVRIVDANGGVCIVHNVQIGDDRRLTVTADRLLHCEGYL